MPLSSAQDHKRIFDDDRGPNTGGMGAFSPSPRMTADVERRVLDDIVRPVLEGMEREGHPFRGFLYVGLMLTADGPKVVEFNVRFGDPEAQVVMPRLDEDLSWLLGSAATGALPSRPARFRDEPHVGVVLATAGYPDAAKTGQVISGLDTASGVPGALVFHAATSRRDRELVTAGGRVLTVVGRGAGYREAIDVAYRAASHIRFDGMQFRTDIGRKALDSTAMKYAVVTFGCRVNQADSLVIEDGLRRAVALAASPEEADIVVVNTCSVTASADQAARQTVRRIARLNPEVRVIVTGCYATRQPAEVSALPNVVRVVGNDDKGRCRGLRCSATATVRAATAWRPASPVARLSRCASKPDVTKPAATASSRERAGTGRSRPLPAVLDDVRRAVDAGYKEIAITGVHLGSYGRDLDDGSSLATLVAALGDWNGRRPVSHQLAGADGLHARDRRHGGRHRPAGAAFPPSAAARVATRCFARCGGRIRRRIYRGLIDRVRTALPDAAIGSDIIVGFPGEDEAHFEELRALLEELPLTHLHVFPYSDRPGTEASRMLPKVDGRVVRERGRIVRDIGERMSRRFKASQEGRSAAGVDRRRRPVGGDW